MLKIIVNYLMVVFFVFYILFITMGYYHIKNISKEPACTHSSGLLLLGSDMLACFVYDLLNKD